MIRCWLFGHVRLRLGSLDPHLLGVNDLLGVRLLEVHLCARCHGLFWVAST